MKAAVDTKEAKEAEAALKKQAQLDAFNDEMGTFGESSGDRFVMGDALRTLGKGLGSQRPPQRVGEPAATLVERALWRMQLFGFCRGVRDECIHNTMANIEDAFVKGVAAAKQRRLEAEAHARREARRPQMYVIPADETKPVERLPMEVEARSPPILQ